MIHIRWVFPLLCIISLSLSLPHFISAYIPPIRATSTSVDLDGCSPLVPLLPYPAPTPVTHFPPAQNPAEPAYLQVLWSEFPMKNVTSLPGWPVGQALNELHYTGYSPVVDKSQNFVNGSSLFYWFQGALASASRGGVLRPTEIPIMIFLEGGPGCASTYATMKEMGAMTVEWNDDDINCPVMDSSPGPDGDDVEDEDTVGSTASGTASTRRRRHGHATPQATSKARPYTKRSAQSHPANLASENAGQAASPNDCTTTEMDEMQQKQAKYDRYQSLYESYATKKKAKADFDPEVDDTYPFHLEVNPNSWNQLAHLLFIDAPMGTGFSSPPGSEFYNTDTQGYVSQLYSAIYNIFQQPALNHLASNPIYFFGDSYAGRWIPEMSYFIQARNAQAAILNPNRGKGNAYWYFNLTGVGIGNPWLDPMGQTTVFGCQFHQFGLITPSELRTYNDEVTVCAQWVNQSLASKAVTDWTQTGWYCDAIYESLLNQTGPSGDIVEQDDSRYWVNDPCDYENETLIDVYYNHPDVMAALGSRPNVKWTWCSDAVECYLESEEMKSAVPALTAVWNAVMTPGHYLNILVYVGAMDLTCGVSSVQSVFRRILMTPQQFDCATQVKQFWHSPLEFPTNGDSPDYDDADGLELSGYVITFPDPTPPPMFDTAESDAAPTCVTPSAFPRLQLLTVLEAGHLVIQSQPERSFDIFQRLITTTPYINGPQDYNLDIPTAPFTALPPPSCIDEGDGDDDDDDTICGTPGDTSLRILLIILVVVYFVTLAGFLCLYNSLKNKLKGPPVNNDFTQWTEKEHSVVNGEYSKI